MKSNRQARHILGLDHKISNQRKIVTDGLGAFILPALIRAGDKSSVVNNPTGRKRPAEK
ncbi:stationary-phase-induced ribosome-associated protein [Escherichia coli]|uniref:Stationary-phase-induced ribosome-associated protein n=1 Tax=Escherichia coli TaxID=562 RepID=A0A8S0FU41_ECOLX|nr:stationary-phase-induced ribosome-associated protein [Escherichia coli]